MDRTGWGFFWYLELTRFRGVGIEVFYNRRRRHTTLGGKAPAVFEALAERQVVQAA